MNVEISQLRDTLIVRVHGEMDLAMADQLRNEIDRQLDELPARNLIFELANVSFMDSSGLGVLLGRYKRISAGGGKIVLTRPQPQVRRIIDLAGISRIMGVFETETEAMQEISAHQGLKPKGRDQ